MRALQIGLAGFASLAASLAVAQAPEAASSTGTATATATAAAAPAGKLRYTDDYRISVNHDADSDGEIVFRVTMKDGKAMDITATIRKGTNENDVARAIKKAFVDQLGTKNYNIEMEDGESVIIERSGGKSDTSLVLVSSTVKGVTVKVHYD